MRASSTSTDSAERGFTLLELLIVVGIISILASIGLVNFQSSYSRAKVSRAKADMRTIVVGLEAYNVDYNTYPPNPRIPQIENLTTSPPRNMGYNVTPWQLTTPVAFISSLPGDPERTDGLGRTMWGYFFPEFESQTESYNYYRIISGTEFTSLLGARPSVRVSTIAVDPLDLITFSDDQIPDKTGFNAGAFRKYGEFVLWGAGPDGDIWNMNDDFQTPGNPGSLLDSFGHRPWGFSFDVPYDPTNGTVSWGNVIRTQIAADGAGRAIYPGDDGTDDPNDDDSGDDDSGGDDDSNENNGSGAGEGGSPSSPSGLGSGGTNGGNGGGRPAPGPPGGGGSGGGGSAGVSPPGGDSGARPASPARPQPAISQPRPDLSAPLVAMQETAKETAPQTTHRVERHRSLFRKGSLFWPLMLLLLGLLLFLIYAISHYLKSEKDAKYFSDASDITDETLSRMPGLAQKTSLHLANNQISNHGLAHVSQCKKLKTLNLWGADITDEGLVHISGLKNLEELILLDTPITDKGVTHLTRLKNLKELNLHGTKVTAHGIAILAESLPDTCITTG